MENKVRRPPGIVPTQRHFTPKHNLDADVRRAMHIGKKPKKPRGPSIWGELSNSKNDTANAITAGVTGGIGHLADGGNPKFALVAAGIGAGNSIVHARKQRAQKMAKDAHFMREDTPVETAGKLAAVVSGVYAGSAAGGRVGHTIGRLAGRAKNGVKVGRNIGPTVGAFTGSTTANRVVDRRKRSEKLGKSASSEMQKAIGLMGPPRRIGRTPQNMMPTKFQNATPIPQHYLKSNARFISRMMGAK